MDPVLFLLDTNTFSYIVTGRSAGARRRMQSLSANEEVCISAITEAEVRYGLARRPMKREAMTQIELLLDAIDVAPWASDAARAYARLRSSLDGSGKMLGNMDLLIAAHALSLGATLVTNDQAFGNVSELLRFENWADDLPPRSAPGAGSAGK